MSFIVNITTLPNLLDLISPSSCRGCGLLGEPLCARCKNYILNQHQDICPICKTKQENHLCKNHPHLPPVYVLGERSGLLDQIIQEYKYNTVRSLAKPLAKMVNAILPAFEEQTILVPLPTSFKHIRERGFDHTLLIAKQLAKIHHLKVQKLLLRVNNTTQVGSDRETRLTQAKSAYKINSKLDINPHATYLLFDDIWTTGASMDSAVKKLQQAGVLKIIIVLLAVSRLD